MKKIDEQVIFITGSTDGIGKLAALDLAKLKAEVVIHGRNQEKVRHTVEELKSKSGNQKISGFTADLASLAEVRRLAADVLSSHPRLDVLINNAGVGSADERYSRDGFELRFAVNYLAPFLLTHLVLPTLKQAAPSRIVNVSSLGQHPLNFNDIMLEKNFDGLTAYRQSKLALIMFTIDLAEQLIGEQITVNCLHPGTYLNTNMVRRSAVTPLGEPESGAEAEVFLATHPGLEGITGKFFNVKNESGVESQANNPESRKQLWELSMELTNLKLEKAY